jgi:transcriptional regulator NrdR family protein
MAKKDPKKHAHIVKRKGHLEPYNEKKLYQSIYLAGLNCHYPKEKADAIAKGAMKTVHKWVHDRHVVTTKDIRNEVLKSVRDKHVSLMYKHHLDIS